MRKKKTDAAAFMRFRLDFERSLGTEELYIPARCVSHPGSAAEDGVRSEPAPPDSIGAEHLDEIRQRALTCTRCELHRTRKNVVFGCGDGSAELMFVGEAPGADEDAQGIPFIGRAGKLLDKIIKAMRLARKEVYICNVLKCRPPGNRTPLPDEVAACSPFLFEQITTIRPKVICALGAPAAHTLLHTKSPIGRLRGKFHPFTIPGEDTDPIPLMPTYHPAYLLRSPWEKPKVWEDVKQIMELLGRPLE